MTDEPNDPAEMLEMLEDPNYVRRMKSGAEQRERLKPNVDAILAGIRFIHDYAQTREGKVAAEAALEAGFFEMVPSEDGNVYAVPRFIWPDSFYDELCPGHSFHVACGVAIGRHMLWGAPGTIDLPRGKGALGRAIVEAIRHFRAERAH